MAFISTGPDSGNPVHVPMLLKVWERKDLPWLKRVKEELGMYTATEVANVKHVYDALKAGIDIIWLGARTTANPFAVQEIADSLKGVDVPVLIKNPINPDVELWIGAFERLNRAGINKTGSHSPGIFNLQQNPVPQ